MENQANLTTLLARFQGKDFYAIVQQPLDEDRDARNCMVGFTHVFRFAQDRHYIRLGYQYDYENSDGRNYSYAGNRFLAGGQYTLPWGSTRLKYDFDLHQRGLLLREHDPARDQSEHAAARGLSSRTTSSASSRSWPRTSDRSRSAVRRPPPVR